MDGLRDFRLLTPGGGASNLTTSTRQARARSVDVLSSRDSGAQKQKNESIENLSKLKDFDLKKSIDARVERLAQSLGGPPSASTSSESSRRLQRRSRLLLNSEATPEPPSVYVPTVVVDPRVTPRRGRGFSVPPVSNTEVVVYSRRNEQPYAIEKLSQSSNAVERRGNVLLRGGTNKTYVANVRLDLKDLDGYRSRSHIHELLESLRASDSIRQELQQPRRRGEDSIALNGRSSVRAEVDSFAALLNKVRLPSTIDDVRRSKGQDDFYTRLERSRGDLNRLETLVGRTFHWSVVGGPVLNRAEPIVRTEVKMRTGPQDVVQFIAHGDGVDYSRNAKLSSSEQAIRWAQQRRERLEAELERERRREPHYRTPRPLGADEWAVTGSPEPVNRFEYSRYSGGDDTEDLYDIPTVVRPSSAYRRHAGAASVEDLNSENVVQTKSARSYSRSSSDTVVTPAPGRSADLFQDKKTVGRWLPSKVTAAAKTEAATPTSSTSEVRRHVREVLDKYKK